MVNNTVCEGGIILSSRLLNPFDSNVESSIVRSLYGFQTVAIDCNLFQRSFPSFPLFSRLSSEIALLSDKNLNRRPLLGQVVNLDQLLSIQNQQICSRAAACPIPE